MRKYYRAWRISRYMRRYVIAETAILSMLAANGVQRSDRRRFMRELVAGKMTITKVLAFIENEEAKR